MALTRYEPWSLLDRLQREMNGMGLYENLFGERTDTDNSNIATSHWRPAVDIREEDDRFVIHADLPGVDPKDIEITMDNGVLSLKGERSVEKNEEDSKGYTRIERAHGTFYRRFSLPDTADADRIEAKGKNGVLEITLPKLEQKQPKRITVKS
ncbi:MAG: Hsp20/alpha crystallin family protein [Gammaproteobacteria bacterium]|nr:Hsp20/alpha crystallin family protein [Gammaproteobacteria bacterium]